MNVDRGIVAYDSNPDIPVCLAMNTLHLNHGTSQLELTNNSVAVSVSAGKKRKCIGGATMPCKRSSGEGKKVWVQPDQDDDVWEVMDGLKILISES